LPATAEELGLTRKQVHEARLIRDAERADPGIVRRTLNERVERDEEPTKAALRQAVVEAAGLSQSFFTRGLLRRFAPPSLH
jgi:hypothetical protein